MAEETLDQKIARARAQRLKGLTPAEIAAIKKERKRKFAEAAKKQAEEAKKRARARTRKKSTFRKLIEGDIAVPET